MKPTQEHASVIARGTLDNPENLCKVCDGPCEYTAIGKRAPKNNHELSIILAHTVRSDYRPCGE